MKKLFVILHLLFLLVVTAGNADQFCDTNAESLASPRTKFYVGAFTGANWLNRGKIREIRTKSETGVTAALSIGYKLNSGFRTEAEVAYRQNNFSDLQRNNVGYLISHLRKYNGHGSSFACSYMANLIYDFDAFSNYLSNFVPYIGFGIGYTHYQARAYIKYNSFENFFGERNQPVSSKLRTWDSGFAYQVIGGIGYYLTNSTMLTTEYHYFNGTNGRVNHSVGLAIRQSF